MWLSRAHMQLVLNMIDPNNKRGITRGRQSQWLTYARHDQVGSFPLGICGDLSPFFHLPKVRDDVIFLGD